MELVRGGRLGGYTLLCPIGAGGMAEVWAAQHPLLGVNVALKILFDQSPRLKERLLREGRAQAGLRHPNILPVRDILQVSGTLVLVLPLVEGPSLDALLSRHRPDEAAAIGLFESIVEGVAHAHSQGLIHRDLKPANILLEERRGRIVPRIADFGLVKNPAETGQTRSAVMMGTPHYAAPEQLDDAAWVDSRADLYSLGAVLVELLTGQRPFPRGSLTALLRAREDSPDLRAVPPQWAPLCQALLAFRPEDRPDSCAAVLRSLRAAALPTEPALRADSPLARAVRAAWSLETPESPAVAETVAESQATWESPADSAPPSTRPERPSNLPAERDAFFGRQDALAELAEGLSRRRLVSVLGFGGAGKTRLAVRYAHQHPSSDGVWFIDLSQARSAEDVISATGAALGVTLLQDPGEQLGHAIAGRGRCLIIFDNFEQVVAAAEQTVGRWMARAPDARFIVTSRVVLDMPGEQILSLEPLKTAEACALFAERARTRKVTFRLTEQSRSDVAELVARLDHLPLAIELVAARIRLMSPRQMLSRMGQRFRLLSGGRSGTSSRQATLRATIDWSWALLSDWEQAALTQCSVFEGGFTLEAAEAVLDLSALDDAPWPMDAVQSLVDKSLLRPLGENRLGEMRFGMLMSIHDYTREKLAAQNTDAVEALKLRHMAFFTAMGEPGALEALSGRDGPAHWWSLAAEVDNLLAATRTAIAHSAAEEAVQLCCALHPLARRRKFSLLTEQLAAVRRMPVLADTPILRSRLFLMRNHREHPPGQWAQILADYEDALAFFQATGDRLFVGDALLKIARLSRDQEQLDRSEDCLLQALAIFQQLGHHHLEIETLSAIGNLQFKRSRYPKAQQTWTRALTLCREGGYRSNEANILGLLGMVYRRTGQQQRALDVYSRALDMHRDSGNRRYEAFILGNIGVILKNRGKLSRARTNMEAALAIHRALGNQRDQAPVLGNLAMVCQSEERFEEAAVYHHEALALHRVSQNRRAEGIEWLNLGELHRLQGQWAEARESLQAALTIHRELKNTYNMSFALLNLGSVAREQGHIDDAVRDLTAAREHFHGFNDRVAEGHAWLELGACHLARGDQETGLRALDAGEALLSDAAPSMQVEGLCRRAELAAAYGLAADAVETLRRARAVAAGITDDAAASAQRALSRAQRALASAH